MDPVLSSTLDFDEYIKSNLKLSGQKFAAASSARSDPKYGSRHGGDAKERPRSGSSTRTRYQEDTNNFVGSSYSSDCKPLSNSKDMSSDFFQLNISKFGQAKPVIAPPKATYNKNRPTREETPPSSPPPPVVLQHSWKAHVVSSRPSTATPVADPSSYQSARVDRTANGTPYRSTRPSNANYDEDDDLDAPSHTPLSKLRPQPPLPYRSPAPPLSPHRLSKPNTGWSLYSNNRNSDYASPITSPSRKLSLAKSAQGRSDVSINEYPDKSKSHLSMDADFSEYKVRLVTLKRSFASWAVHARERAEQLAQQCKDVQENSIYWPKHSCFTWWKMLTQASNHVKTLRYRRGLRKWCAHQKRHRRHLRALRRAVNHHKYHMFVHFMNAMVKLGRRRRQRKRMRRLQAMSFDHWTSQLLKRVYNTWNQFITKKKADRLLDEEQNKRRDKIAQFMRRVQQPSPATNLTSNSNTTNGRAEAKGTASFGRNHIGSGNRPMAEAKNVAPSTNANTSSVQNQPVPLRESKRTDRTSHSPAHSLARSSASTNNNTQTQMKMDDECSDDECVEPFQRLSVQPARYPSKDPSSNPSNAVETTEEDYEDEMFESEEPPPPTYEQLMRQSLSTRSPGKPSAAGIAERNNPSALPPPPFSTAAARAESRSKTRSALTRRPTVTNTNNTAGATAGASGRAGVSGIPRSSSAPRGGSRGGPASTLYGTARMPSHPISVRHERTAQETGTDDGAATFIVSASGMENTHDGLTGTFEERAAARRERTLLLRKQAEERIQEKHQQKAAADRQKLERENEEAEIIRKEARAKQVQAKTYADRQRVEATEHLRHLLSLAKHFRQTQLLVRCGLAPWQRYMEMVRLNTIKADNFRHDRLLQVTWSAFLGYIIALRTERYRKEHRQTAVAIAHHRRKLMRAVWRTLRLHHKVIVAKAKAVTGHFSRFTLCRRSFRGWRVAYERSVRLSARQLHSVQPRGDLCTKRHYWRRWQEFHQEQLEEREIRQRVNSKWAAVQGWMDGGL